MNGRGVGHPTGHRGAEVRALFDRIAGRYDLLNHLLSMGIDRRWRCQLADEVAHPEPRLILDLCTGTGDMAVELARPERGLASVVAVDFSPAMIALAARKLARAGLRARVQPCVGDALRLPFSDGVFDAVTVAFGIRNFEHTARGLAEAARVLRPGGLLGVLEFLRPSDANPLTGLGALYRRHFLPLIATLAGGDPGAYRYLPTTVDRFDSATEMTTRLASLGFDRTQVRPLTLGIASLILARR
jgi:demethylmenaquinone methyltransferase/2-methoxy-6-polyprenyl-1,4-benzoquinol methylase